MVRPPTPEEERMYAQQINAAEAAYNIKLVMEFFGVTREAVLFSTGTLPELAEACGYCIISEIPSKQVTDISWLISEVDRIPTPRYTGGQELDRLKAIWKNLFDLIGKKPGAKQQEFISKTLRLFTNERAGRLKISALAEVK